MNTHNIKGIKIKVLVIVVLICEFAVFSPFKSTVSAHEISSYLNGDTVQQVAQNNVNTNLANKPQPPTPAEIAEVQRKAELEERAQRENARARVIDNFLVSKNSPLAGHGKKLVEVERIYGVSPNIIIAIAGVESSYCQINFKPYNCWGWFTGKNFVSYDHALELYADYLSSFYYARGYDTPAAMAKIYCPPTWESWLGKVNSFMARMPF